MDVDTGHHTFLKILGFSLFNLLEDGIRTHPSFGLLWSLDSDMQRVRLQLKPEER